MKIYYFKKPITIGYNTFGTGEDYYCKSERELIKICKNYYGGLDDNYFTGRKITTKAISDFNFYAIQGWRDGFGNDTYTEVIFKTKEEGEKYIEKNSRENLVIVGQYWGKEYNNYWE